MMALERAFGENVEGLNTLNEILKNFIRSWMKKVILIDGEENINKLIQGFLKKTE